MGARAGFLGGLALASLLFLAQGLSLATRMVTGSDESTYVHLGCLALGVSLLTPSAPLVDELMIRLRKAMPSLIVVMGNIHATVFDQYYLSERLASFIVHHEGEATMLELMQAVRRGARVVSLTSDFELIVIDDGSTDGTAAIVEEHQRTRPWLRLYRNAKNRGPGFNTNLAISLAGKDYLFGQTVDWSYDISQLPQYLHHQVGERLYQSGVPAQGLVEGSQDPGVPGAIPQAPSRRRQGRTALVRPPHGDRHSWVVVPLGGLAAAGVQGPRTDHSQ